MLRQRVAVGWQLNRHIGSLVRVPRLVKIDPYTSALIPTTAGRTIQGMSKTPQRRKKTDRHKGEKISLNFPPQLMAAMRDLADANLRTLTAEMTLAMQAHLAAAGKRP